MKITTKFRLILLAVGLMMVGVNYYLLWSTHAALNNITHSSEESLSELFLLQRIKFLTNELVVDIMAGTGNIDHETRDQEISQLFEALESVREKEELVSVQDQIFLIHLTNEYRRLIREVRKYKSEKTATQTLADLQKRWFPLAITIDEHINKEIEEFHQDFDQAEKESQLMATREIAVTVFAFAMLIGTAVLLDRIVIHPLRKLDYSLATMLDKDQLEEIPPVREDEFGNLTRSFNKLVNNLEQSLTRLKKSNTQLSEANNALLTRNMELNQRNRQILDQKVEIDVQNRDLRGFAYAVSHDLKTPLRGMVNLVSWLKDEYHDTMDETGRKYLNLLSERSSKLHRLVTGILEYSEKSDAEFQTREEVNVIEMIESIIELIASSKEVKFIYDRNVPTIRVAKMGLQQILLNLITNAIDYNDKEVPEVEIKFEQDSKLYQFTVIDNGPGIDPRFHEKIFELFKTLGKKGNNNQLATGIGLATVKRITAKLGGTINVVSEVGKGSAFVFTISKEVAANQTKNNLDIGFKNGS